MVNLSDSFHKSPEKDEFHHREETRGKTNFATPQFFREKVRKVVAEEIKFVCVGALSLNYHIVDETHSFELAFAFQKKRRRKANDV